MWYVLNTAHPAVGMNQGLLEELSRVMRPPFVPSGIEDVEYEDISDTIDNEPCYV